MNPGNQAVTAKNPHQEWAPVMELAAKEVFELMLGSELAPANGVVAPAHDITAMVGLAGHLCGVMTLQCSWEAAAAMASKMLGSEAAIEDRQVRDAFGEVGNMVAGNFKNKLAGMGDQCMLSVPTVISGSNYSVRSLADSDPLETTLLFEGKPFVITLEIHT